MAILTTILSVSAISGVLALVIILQSIFSTTTANARSISTTGQKILKVEGGSTLLNTLAQRKFSSPRPAAAKRPVACAK